MEIKTEMLMYKKFDRACMILLDIYWYLLYREWLVENWFDYLFFLIDFVFFNFFFITFGYSCPPSSTLIPRQIEGCCGMDTTPAKLLLDYQYCWPTVITMEKWEKSSESVWRMIQQSGVPWTHTSVHKY